MTTIEVMRKALEALEWCVAQGGGPQCEHESGGAVCFCKENAAITALRAQIEALEKVEPVAWGMVNADTGLILDVICPEEHDREPGIYTVPLYTAPIAPAIPALTPQDIGAEADDGTTFGDGARWAYALAAERAGVSIK